MLLPCCARIAFRVQAKDAVHRTRRARTRDKRLTCLDKSRRETNSRGVTTKSRRNHLQLNLAPCVLDMPDVLAMRNNWLTTSLKNGRTDPRPHTSFAISSCIAGVSLLPYAEQQKILLSGAKFVLAEEVRSGISGKQRVRLVRSERIRPAGAARA